MKRLFLSIFTVVALGFVSCSDDNDETPTTPSTPLSSPFSDYTTEELNTEIESSDATSTKFEFTASEAWSISVEDVTKSGCAWLTIKPMSGEAGKNEVTITTDGNESEEARSAQVSISCGESYKPLILSLTQKGVEKPTSLVPQIPVVSDDAMWNLADYGDYYNPNIPNGTVWGVSDVINETDQWMDNQWGLGKALLDVRIEDFKIDLVIPNMTFVGEQFFHEFGDGLHNLWLPNVTTVDYGEYDGDRGPFSTYGEFNTIYLPKVTRFTGDGGIFGGLYKLENLVISTESKIEQLANYISLPPNYEPFQDISEVDLFIGSQNSEFIDEEARTVTVGDVTWGPFKSITIVE